MPVYESDLDRLPLVDVHMPFDDQIDDPETLVPFSSLWTVTNATVPVDIDPSIDIDPSLFNIQLPYLNDGEELALDDDEDILGEFILEENPLYAHDQLGVNVAGNILCSSLLAHKPLTKHLQTSDPFKVLHGQSTKSLLTRPPFLGHRWQYVTVRVIRNPTLTSLPRCLLPTFSSLRLVSGFRETRSKRS